ncbi:2794_t:CDS:2 [Gigaspora margarita]|uniref:2794_t:CDS:1 n=1 Tax=Gigaspora margarita TaxID=4874 RepID=A0ABM8W555_GIGMA|nr:2794_t:CDS:2 [Gigaspora margarita]
MVIPSQCPKHVMKIVNKTNSKKYIVIKYQPIQNFVFDIWETSMSEVDI